MNEADLLKRITVNPAIFAGKRIIRGRRIAVEHILGMPSAGASSLSSNIIRFSSPKTSAPV
ncbi:MAG TPA: DUF433 domain-containing protein [Burkholderiales bacterium]|nr:DUF433 domain-containing protein [Burkholderiales bacterium]